MNKYAEQMEKAALNRLTREIVARPLAFPEKRMQRILGAGSEDVLDAVSRRQGPDPRKMLRSPDAIALGQEYGTRQMLAKRVAGPDAPFAPGSYRGVLSESTNKYIRGANSHGAQWDAEEFRGLWNNRTEAFHDENLPQAKDTRSLREKLKDKWEAHRGRETSLEKQLPYIHSVQKPVLNVNHQPGRMASSMGFKLHPIVRDGGLHLNPEATMNIPAEGVRGYAGLERNVASRHEMFEADSWAERADDSVRGRLGGISRHPNHLSGLGHAGADVLVNEAKMQAKNPWQGILPPSTLEQGMLEGGFASTPISSMRQLRGEDVVAQAARRLSGKNRSAGNLAQETGIPVRSIQEHGMTAVDHVRNALDAIPRRADFALARGKDSFEGSLRYRTPLLVDDFRHQSTYKESMK